MLIVAWLMMGAVTPETHKIEGDNMNGDTYFGVAKVDDCFCFIRARFYYRADAEAFAKMIGKGYRVVEI